MNTNFELTFPDLETAIIERKKYRVRKHQNNNAEWKKSRIQKVDHKTL